MVGPNIRHTGDGAKIAGPNATVRGDNNMVVGPNARVIGDNNMVIGSNAHVTGDENTIRGPNATVSGDANEGYGDNAVITGDGNKWCGHVCVESGAENVITTPEYGSAQTNSGTIVNNFGSSGREKRSREQHEEDRFVEGPTPNEAEQDEALAEDDDDDTNACTICMSNKACCVVSPCMHGGLCATCARGLCFGQDEEEQLKKLGDVHCPRCRRDVESIKRVY